LLGEYLGGGSARWSGATALRVRLLLASAEDSLTRALEGDLEQLTPGFAVVAEVLAAAPDQAATVDAILTRYINRLPEIDPCIAMAHLDWLHGQPRGGGHTGRAIDESRMIATHIMVSCGDQLLTEDPQAALAAFQSALDRYPDDGLAPAAAAGIHDAETLIEAQEIRDLVRGSQARYCATPAPYRGASPYQGSGGPHLLFTLGSLEFAQDVPPEWRATDVTQATLVLCVKGPELGQRLRSCFYEGDHTVSLHATSYEVRAFELRTGALAFDTTVEFGGDCPNPLQWECPSLTPNCPPPLEVRATQADTAVRNAVRGWVFR
jgi:hypothetical protein